MENLVQNEPSWVRRNSSITASACVRFQLPPAGEKNDYAIDQIHSGRLEIEPITAPFVIFPRMGTPLQPFITKVKTVVSYLVFYRRNRINFFTPYTK